MFFFLFVTSPSPSSVSFRVNFNSDIFAEYFCCWYWCLVCCCRLNINLFSVVAVDVVTYHAHCSVFTEYIIIILCQMNAIIQIDDQKNKTKFNVIRFTVPLFIPFGHSGHFFPFHLLELRILELYYFPFSKFFLFLAVVCIWHFIIFFFFLPRLLCQSEHNQFLIGLARV